MSIGNPWGAAAQSYGQDLDQLTKIQMGGMQQAAQMPLQLYDRFMDGYEKARQRAAQEKQLEMQQAQLDRQNRLADLKFQQDKEHQDYVIREDQRKRVMGGLKDVADTSGDLVDKYTPDARGVFKQRFRNAALAQGKSPEEADAFSESMMPSLKSTPVVSTVQPENPDNAAFNAEADLPDAWSFSPGSSMEDTFKGRMVLRDEETARKNQELERYRIGKESEDRKEAQRRLDQGDAKIAQGDRKLDMMGARLDTAGQVKPKAVPATALQKITENLESRRRIQEAIDLIEKNPDAIGPKNIVLKHPVGSLAMGVLRAKDDGGNETRAAVQGIANLVLHDLSGAAVTLSEDTRFQQVLAQLHDQPAAALIKLRKLLKQYDGITGTMQEAYSSDNGYMDNSVIKGGGKKPTDPAAQPKDGETRADGAKYSARGGGWFKIKPNGMAEKVN